MTDQCICSCHKIGKSNGECCDCHLGITHNFYSFNEKKYKLNEELNEIKEKLKELETGLNLVRALGSRAFHPKQPYKCPVCDGEGINRNKLVVDGVKEPSTIKMKNPECNSCEGKGIVWSP